MHGLLLTTAVLCLTQTGPHSDIYEDGRVDLTELLRIVQMFNLHG